MTTATELKAPYQLPFDEWQKNYSIDVSGYLKKVKGEGKKSGEFSLDYISYNDMVPLVKEYCPDFWVSYSIDLNPNFGGIIKAVAHFGDKEGLLYYVPIMRLGAGSHNAIMAPTATDICSNIKRAWVRVASEATGLAWSLWTKDEPDPYEQAQQQQTQQQQAPWQQQQQPVQNLFQQQQQQPTQQQAPPWQQQPQQQVPPWQQQQPVQQQPMQQPQQAPWSGGEFDDGFDGVEYTSVPSPQQPVQQQQPRQIFQR